MGKSNYVKKLEKENVLYKRMWKKRCRKLIYSNWMFLKYFINE